MLKAISNPETKNIFETTSLLDITKRGLLTLVALQGQETNIESGEQPGKFIHEYRKDNIERGQVVQGIDGVLVPLTS